MSMAPIWISQRPNRIRTSAISIRIKRIPLTLLQTGVLGILTVLSSLKSAIVSFDSVRDAAPAANPTEGGFIGGVTKVSDGHNLR
jgi:hypothetical protein